jgi:hypothetical protein
MQFILSQALSNYSAFRKSESGFEPRRLKGCTRDEADFCNLGECLQASSRDCEVFCALR